MKHKGRSRGVPYSLWQRPWNSLCTVFGVVPAYRHTHCKACLHVAMQTRWSVHSYIDRSMNLSLGGCWPRIVRTACRRFVP